MKERPILFSAPMVRAILEGRKVQTRRAVKHPPELSAYMGRSDDYGHGGYHFSSGRPPFTGGEATRDFRATMLHCPYGQPGDRLWVREAWRQAYPKTAYSQGVIYRADAVRALGMDEFSDRHKWKPSIHMPRVACRIVLEITDVRVQRLQEISEADAVAEGAKSGTGGICGDDDIMVPIIMSDHDMRNLDKPMMPAPIARFVLLWDSINGKQPGVTNWNANPWVWALTFRPVTP